MISAALKKIPASVMPSNDVQGGMDTASAGNVADVWMNITGAETALAQMTAQQSGILAWSAAPTMQNIMAAMAGPVMEPGDRVFCAGFQSYPWAMAVNADTKNIACQYLGKISPDTVQSMTIEDIAACLTASPGGAMIVVAMHIENAKGWDDVRAVSAAAVKSENAALILVSSAVAAPKGAAVETLALSVVDQWQTAAAEMQMAISQVRDHGAIRVIACIDDVSAASAENAMIVAAGMNPSQWTAQVTESQMDAERALWAAWQAPEQTF